MIYQFVIDGVQVDHLGTLAIEKPLAVGKPFGDHWEATAKAIGKPGQDRLTRAFNCNSSPSLLASNYLPFWIFWMFLNKWKHEMLLFRFLFKFFWAPRILLAPQKFTEREAPSLISDLRRKWIKGIGAKKSSRNHARSNSIWGMIYLPFTRGAWHCPFRRYQGWKKFLSFLFKIFT